MSLQPETFEGCPRGAKSSDSALYQQQFFPQNKCWANGAHAESYMLVGCKLTHLDWVWHRFCQTALINKNDRVGQLITHLVVDSHLLGFRFGLKGHWHRCDAWGRLQRGLGWKNLGFRAWGTRESRVAWEPSVPYFWAESAPGMPGLQNPETLGFSRKPSIPGVQTGLLGNSGSAGYGVQRLGYVSVLKPGNWQKA